MILGLLKNILVFISLFYLTFYIPFVLTAYNPYWMKYNCNLHKRCDLIGIEKADRAMNNLTSFLMHREELGKEWKRNERIHLSEVRDIFDTMFFAAVISAVVLAAFRNKRPKLYKFAAVNIIVALCLLIVLLILRLSGGIFFTPYCSIMICGKFREVTYFFMLHPDRFLR